MRKLIECVPNFSEGKDEKVIDAIAQSIRDTKGCSLLDVESDGSTNRTVYTVIGDMESIIQGAVNSAGVAYNLVDMTKHKGEHPRFGALDVCPFIPLCDSTMDDAILCANRCAKLISEKYNVPIYLYGLAATKEDRERLPNIRKGEYEGLQEKILSDEWKPDYGPAAFVPKWGASAVGARKFLIAINVNLLSTKEQAHKIALNIRESGRGPSKPGRLKGVQAIGWYLADQRIAQVSANIVDCDVTKIHQLYDEVCSDAKELNLPVIGTQIVGLVPLGMILDAAEHYIEKENLFILEESAKVQFATHKLGLANIWGFDPNQKIIEYVIKDEAAEHPLSSLPLNRFISSVAERTPTPGGGSVAAAVSSLGVALCVMGGNLSYGRKQFESIEGIMRQNIPPVHEKMTKLIPLIDADANAFSTFMKALKLPSTTIEEKKTKEEAMHDGIIEAIAIPLKVIETANLTWPHIKEIAKHNNKNCISDIQVGVKCIETGIWSAYQNVVINLNQIKDEEEKERIKSDADKSVAIAAEQCNEILKIIEERK